jgi:hypothetical protein
MSTSGSTDYSLTARQVIEYALRKINVTANGNTPSSEVADDALVELNVMLKEWMKYDSIWRLTETSLTPTADTASISMSSANPYRVIDVRYRNTDSIDLPMMELTRQEYYDIPQKTSTGTPTSWYFDPQRATNTLYIWPVLDSVTTETLRVTYQRRYEDVDDLSNEIDVPQEHLAVVGYNLASRLADRYGKSGLHVDRIVARAESMLEDILDADRPEVIRFVPESRYG